MAGHAATCVDNQMGRICLTGGVRKAARDDAQKNLTRLRNVYGSDDDRQRREAELAAQKSLELEQKLHEVCVGLSANKAKAATLVDEAQAAALQDAKLTTFAQALTAWRDGSMTAEQNHTITTTCRSEIGGAPN